MPIALIHSRPIWPMRSSLHIIVIPKELDRLSISKVSDKYYEFRFFNLKYIVLQTEFKILKKACTFVTIQSNHFT